MQSTNQPPKFLIPFAQNDAAKVEIPATTTDPARFSQSLGSPPATGMPPEAGGVPPQLEDFNGAIYQQSRIAWWLLAGGRFGYDSTWANDTLIGGYAAGAVLPSADKAGEWYNASDNNVTDPDSNGANWVPGYHYGAYALTGLTGGTINLLPSTAINKVLTVAGTLTSNQVLIVPNWIYDWDVYNNTSGAFSLTVKTAAGTGAVIPQNGAPTPVRGDGTNITLVAANIAPATSATQAMQLGQAIGRLLDVKRITASGTYTPTAGTKRIVVELVGGGGGGAGTPATGTAANSAGGGGGAGAYMQFLLNTVPATVAVTIGGGGIGGTAASPNADPGTSSVFGSYSTVGGGGGGLAGTQTSQTATSNFASQGGAGGTTLTSSGVTVLKSSPGNPGTAGISLSGGATIRGGDGGGSAFGGNAHAGTTTALANAQPNTGAGGAGVAAPQNTASVTGGAGGSGCCIVWEYA